MHIEHFMQRGQLYLLDGVWWKHQKARLEGCFLEGVPRQGEQVAWKLGVL